jgi:hypothetical protein
MRKPASLLFGLLGLLLAAAAARAQPAAPPQGESIVRSEAAIVAGNAVNAKKRALADAFRQVVERTYAELIKEGAAPQPMPPALLQLRASLANSSQKFISKYRIVEEATEGGVLHLMVEADVDSVGLRREIERARATSTAPVSAQAGKPVANFMLVAGEAPLPTRMVSALTAQGMRVQLDRSATEPLMLANAANQNSYSLFVTLKTVMEGGVRGTTMVSVKCTLGSRVFQPGAQVGRGPSLQRTDEERGFGQDEPGAHNACLDRVVGVAARELASALRLPVVSSAFITLQLDIASPGPVSMLVQTLKRMGGVTATEVRQVTATTTELRVFTRVGGMALQQAIIRELGGKLQITPAQSTNDVVVLKLRSQESAALEENR